MRPILLIQSVFFLLLVVISCDNYPCAKATLVFGLVGFSDTESDTIIIRRFEKQGTLKDTLLLDNNNVRFSRRQDTLEMAAFTSAALLVSDYNYEIFFPQANKLENITNIQEQQSTGKNSGLGCYKDGCVNRITGYTLNGQQVVYNDYYPVYFHR